MQIDVYSILLAHAGAIRTWLSMEWVEGYNSKGSMILECVKTPKNLELLKVENLCVLTGESDCPMVITSRKVSSDRITVWGIPAAWWILNQRVSTEVISGGAAEAQLCGLVRRMATWPKLELDWVGAPDAVYPAQFSDGSLDQYAEAIGTASDMGFRIRKEGKFLYFGCYQPGENENAVFRTAYGNLADPELTETSNGHKNVAIVAGAGEGDARVTVEVGDTSAISNMRREMYVDARNVQPEDGETAAHYKNRLKAVGRQKLAEALEISNVTFTAKGNDVRLGDICKVILDDLGITLQVRCTTKTIKSQKNTVTRTLGVGNPIVRR